jgi:signal transduction histidine kinase
MPAGHSGTTVACVTGWRVGIGWLRRHPLTADGLLAAALSVFNLAVVAGWNTAPGSGYRPVDGVAYALALLATAPLVLRRRYPLAVLFTAGFAVFLLAARSYPWGSTGTVMVVAVYTVGAYGDRRRISVAVGWLVISLVAIRATSPPDFDNAILAVNLVAFCAVLYLGWTVQQRRRQAALLQDRNRELQIARGQLAREAAAAERLRIARELHDVIAHSISVIAVQSSVGREQLRTNPDNAERALAAIESGSRSALAELRRLLGVLRPGGQPSDRLAPTPGLADMDTLLTDAHQAGLVTRYTVHGEQPDGVPPGLDLSAYRIIQEALTNTIKHAGPATASISISWTNQQLTIDVSDDGRGPAAAPSTRTDQSAGQGLIGMRERVTLFGGDLSTGPRPGGGFRVVARLPFARTAEHVTGASP